MPFPRPKKTDSEDVLYEYAVGALARRMRSVAELKRLLRPRVEADTEYGKTLVELVIRRLKDQGYLNDAKYAAAFSSFRRDNEKFGRRRVITDLKAKGCSRRSHRQGGGFGLRRSQRREAGSRLPAPQAAAETKELRRMQPASSGI